MVGDLSHDHPDGKTPCFECSLLADWAESCNCNAIQLQKTWKYIKALATVHEEEDWEEFAQ